MLEWIMAIIIIIVCMLIIALAIVAATYPFVVLLEWSFFNENFPTNARSAKLPLSTIMPLLNDENIIKAEKRSLRLRDGRWWDESIYIKLSLIDYLRYQWYINRQSRKKAERANINNTLAAINRLNAEYDRINQEAQKSVTTETENIKNIIERIK